MTADGARAELQSLASPAAATAAARFFKTGAGQYAEGDVFIGVGVPALRRLARAFQTMPPDEVVSLLRSPVHEERQLALLVLVLRSANGDETERKQAFDVYLGNTDYINNWDLVDCSAPQVVGGYLLNKAREPLYSLAGSAALWERRIAVVSTQHFIRQGEFGDTLAVVRQLLSDREDLIHKACGWMLREVGKRDRSVLEEFLALHAAEMPRTMLRYAIEKFPPERRRAFLGMKAQLRRGAADGG